MRGEITKLATAIVDEHNKSATIALLKYLNLWTIQIQIEVKRAAQFVNSV